MDPGPMDTKGYVYMEGHTTCSVFSLDASSEGQILGEPISGIQRPVRPQAPTRRGMNHSSGPQSFSVDTQPHYVGTVTMPAPQSSLWVLLKLADHSPSKEDMVQPPPGHVPSRQAWRSDSDLIRSRTRIYQHFQLQEAPCSPKHCELVDLD